MRAVVGLTANRGGAELIGQGVRPFFPGEMSLLTERDRERKNLGLPRFGEHRALCIPRNAKEGGESSSVVPRTRDYGDKSGCRNRIRLAQGSRPTYQYKQHHARLPGRPKALSQRSVPSTPAAASLLENAHWYPGKQRHHDNDRSCRACLARS